MRFKLQFMKISEAFKKLVCPGASTEQEAASRGLGTDRTNPGGA